jgi:TPR repeat protein
MKDTENTNNWIEDTVSKKHNKYYEYDIFNGELENLPSTNEVVKKSKTINHQQNENIDNYINYQISNENSISKNYIENSLYEESLINHTSTISSVDEDLNEKVNDILTKIYEITIEGKDQSYFFLNYIDGHYVNTEEIRNELLNNQNNPNFIFLLGYFSYLGIETIKNEEKAFRLFINASEHNHLLAQYYVGKCYEFGIGTTKNEDLAFKYFVKVINMIDYTTGQLNVDQYPNIDTKKGIKLAVHWYERAVHNGSVIAMRNLGLLYLSGNGIEKNYQKAFDLFRKSADGNYAGGIVMLGYCYYYGIGTKVSFQRAFELFEESANLGHNVAQYNLAFMYKKGKGVKKNINQAMCWYGKSARQGYLNAQYQLVKLEKRKNNAACNII